VCEKTPTNISLKSTIKSEESMNNFLLYGKNIKTSAARDLRMSFCPLCNEPAIIQGIKATRVRWLGHLFRANYFYPWRKITFTSEDGTRKVGRPP
jgi:hypothetical protein